MSVESYIFFLELNMTRVAIFTLRRTLNTASKEIKLKAAVFFTIINNSAPQSR